MVSSFFNIACATNLLTTVPKFESQSNLLYKDSFNTITNHTLPKTDRAFMFFSLEGRAPLLNNFFKSFSKTYLLNNPYSNKKEFLRNYVRNRLGSLYINAYKKGFTPFLDKLAANGEFLNWAIVAEEEIIAIK